MRGGWRWRRTVTLFLIPPAAASRYLNRAVCLHRFWVVHIDGRDRSTDYDVGVFTVAAVMFPVFLCAPECFGFRGGLRFCEQWFWLDRVERLLPFRGCR